MTTQQGSEELSKNELKLIKKCDSYINTLLECIQPAVSSQRKRIAIFSHIKSIMEQMGMKAFIFGSVALKTYIPDGDIDISVFKGVPASNAAWYEEVFNELLRQSNNIHSPFQIT